MNYIFEFTTVYEQWSIALSNAKFSDVVATAAGTQQPCSSSTKEMAAAARRSVQLAAHDLAAASQHHIHHCLCDAVC